jgi:hypothetical protein
MAAESKDGRAGDGEPSEVAGVNPATGLASDYLNHFYEPLLLLEHMGDDPGTLDDLASWSPSSYAAHIRQSGRTDREAVLIAYMQAHPGVRDRFDRVAGEAVQLTAEGLNGLVHTARSGGNINQIASALAEMLRGYIRRLDAIIHGRA